MSDKLLVREWIAILLILGFLFSVGIISFISRC